MTDTTYIARYLRGYILGFALDVPTHDTRSYARARSIDTPFQAGYWKGAEDHFMLMTGALLGELP